MKIVIVGPGAMGLLFAGLLSRSKEEVWLLDRDAARARRLAKNGIRLEGRASLKVQKPRVTTDARSLADADLWILCVKSYDTASAAKAIAAVLSPKANVLSLQNGVGHLEHMAEAIGSHRILVGSTSMGSTRLTEGAVRYTGSGETVVGRLDAKGAPALRDVRQLFGRSRISVRICRDIMSILWSKLVINAGINALSAITGMKNSRLIQSEGTHRILREAITEAAKVAKRKRIKLIYDDVLAKAESVCEATGENISSMLADVLGRKKTEVDFINGVIVRQAQSLGIKTPVNALLVDLIKSIESNYPFQNKD